MVIKRYNELTLDELYDLLSLRCEIFCLEQNCPYNDLDFRDKNAYHLIHTNENGEIVATLRITDKGVRFEEISIGRVVVSQKYRRSGLGTQIMRAALSYIKNELKQDTIRISAQAYLETFYNSLGFVRCSDEYLEDNIPHIEMLCKLK